jgi:hypothetical protein
LWDVLAVTDLPGTVSGMVRNTGSTHTATTAIIAPGTIGQPVR